MTRTATEWKALRKSGSSWVSTDDYAERPLWVRRDNIIDWVDGAQDERFFYYETSRQNNGQFGNVTKIEEGGSGSNRLRATVHEYFPNVNGDTYIVNLPARTRIFGSGGDCHAEMRTLYGSGNKDNHFQTPPLSAVVVKTEQLLNQQNTESGCTEPDANPSSLSIGTYDSDWAITRYNYDQYGNQTTVNQTGVDDNHNIIINTEYDSVYHLFPIRQWNPNRSGFEEKAKYWGVNHVLGNDWSDERFFWGAMAEHCGVNAACTRQAYDEFGRATYRWERVATGTPWANTPATIAQSLAEANARWVYFKRDQSGSNRNVVVEWHAPRCYGNFVRRHYNGLGQLVQEQTPHQDWTANTDGCNPGDNHNEIDVSYQYDALGNQTRASVPTSVSAGWVNRAPSWGAGYTSTKHDVLSRPTQGVAPNGETTNYIYSGRMSYAYISGDGTHRITFWQRNNELGQPWLVRNYRYSGGWQIDATVTLTHDLLDNLTGIDHADGLGATTINYDAASRKKEMIDPDLGHWAYDYDRQGHLTRQTDARGCTTLMEYEPRLGRLTKKHFQYDNRPAGGGTECSFYALDHEVEYRYDENHSLGNRSQGQLMRITKTYQGNEAYRKSIFYNEQGLLAKEEVLIGGAPDVYSLQYGYDDYLRPDTLIYPDGDVVTTGYNSMGLPVWTHSTDRGTIADSASYITNGQLTKLHLTRGTDLWRRQGYYDWKQALGNGNGRLAHIRVGTSDGGDDRLLLTYQYDTFGNIEQLGERFNGGNSTMHPLQYDHQNRVTSAFGQRFSWRPSGNFETVRDIIPNPDTVSTYTYDGTHIHAVDKINGVDRYDYDRNGNMRYRSKGLPSQQRFYFDHENHLVEVLDQNNQSLETYFYDDDGLRVRKTTRNDTTYYPFPHYEVRVPHNTAAAASTGEELDDRHFAPVVELIPKALLNQPVPSDAELNVLLDVPRHAARPRAVRAERGGVRPARRGGRATG